MQPNGNKEYYDHETVDNLSNLFECKNKVFHVKIKLNKQHYFNYLNVPSTFRPKRPERPIR